MSSRMAPARSRSSTPRATSSTSSGSDISPPISARCTMRSPPAPTSAATSYGPCSTTSSGAPVTPIDSASCMSTMPRNGESRRRRRGGTASSSRPWRPSSPMTRVLLADVGGTHARFALLSGNDLGPVQSLDVETHGGIDDAVAHFLAAYGGSVAISEAILAVAGPVADGHSRLTNSGWIVDVGELKQPLRLSQGAPLQRSRGGRLEPRAVGARRHRSVRP